MDLKGKIIDKKYRIIDKIYEDSLSIVWRAQNTNNKLVAFKLLKNKAISIREEKISRFKKDLFNVAKLNVPEISQIYDMGKYEQSYFVVTEMVDSLTLADYYKNGLHLNISESIMIIHDIVKTLSFVHKNKVIHLGLKPSNIILKIIEEDDNRKFQIMIVDFGISQLRIFNFEEPDLLTKTLYFMSPEQLGNIKRTVDIRSDLYSLGVIFYQMLTGKLPFSSDNINVFIHQSIAKNPERLSIYKKDIPKVLENIVLKLLEKEPEKRYQSTEGLLYDLEKYLSGENDFTIGLNDRNIKLSYRTDLIGREKELNILKFRYNEAINGNGSICFVSGEAGLGKTRLVEELIYFVQENAGLSIDGKCFAEENKAPYGPFYNAITKFVGYYSKSPKEQKEKIKSILLEKIGEYGAILTTFHPALCVIFDNFPILTKLEIEKEKIRFVKVICDFLQIIAKMHQGMVIVLDDLQWIDDSSIGFMKKILTEISNYNLIIVGTYSSNEVNEFHPIKQFIKQSNSFKELIIEIDLKPFDEERIKDFIAALLYGKIRNIQEIAKFIVAKSFGNPFFAIEILKQLINEKIIIKVDDFWVCKLNEFHNIKIPPTIVDSIIKRIDMLTEDEVFILSHAAVIGKKFTTDFLFKLLNIDKERVFQLIDKAFELQIIDMDNFEEGKIFFVHDRIKDAFYLTIDEKKKRDLHLHVGTLLEEIYPNYMDNYIYDLAYHFLKANNIKKSIKYIYLAGIKSKLKFANEEAINYFIQTVKLIESQGEIGNQKWCDSMLKAGELNIAIGESIRAIELLKKVQPYKETKIEKSIIYSHISRAYSNLGDFKTSEEYAKYSLNLLGEIFPISRNLTIILIVKEYIVRILYSITGKEKKVKTNQKSLEKYKQIIRILCWLNWTYSLSNALKTVHVTLRALNICVSKIGKSSELGLIYMLYATMFSAMTLFNKAKKYHLKALKIKREINDNEQIAESYHYLGYLELWRGNYAKAKLNGNRAANLYQKMEDSAGLNMALNIVIQSYYYCGKFKCMKLYLDRFYDYAYKSNDSYKIGAAFIYYVQYYRETGNFDEAVKWGTKCIDFTYEIKDWFNYCSINIEFGLLYLEMNKVDKALEYFAIAENINSKNTFILQYIVLLYSYIAEANIIKYYDIYETITNRERKKYQNTIGKMCKKAVKMTKKWITHDGITLRILGLYYSMLRDLELADDYFQKSIEINRKINREFETAKSLYYYGIFFYQQRREKKAKEKIKESYEIFKKIGSQNYWAITAQIIGRNEEKKDVSTEFAYDLRHYQRTSSLIALSQDISSILELDILLKKILDVAISSTGAQSGYLFIKNPKNNSMELILENSVLKAKDKEKAKEEIEQVNLAYRIVNQVLINGNAIITTGIEKNKKSNKFDYLLTDEPISFLCTPMKYKGEMKGVCLLDNKLSRFVFTEDDIEAMNLLMAQAAISIENARLYNEAIKADELEKKNRDLIKAFNIIEKKRDQLVQTEKMASLGGLVAGVAHEINTPIGVLLTAVTHKINRTNEIANKFNLNNITKSELKEYLLDAAEIDDLIYINLEKTSEMIKSFKRISIDVSTKEKRLFSLKECINDVLFSLKAKFKNFNISIKVECDDNIIIDSYPGAFTQIITNLILNSLMHGFRKKKEGNIAIKAVKNMDNIELIYSDDGQGIEEKNLPKIFDPFFTTNRSAGGKGLGLNIIFNLVSKTLNGTIRCESKWLSGTKFIIDLYLSNQLNENIVIQKEEYIKL